MGEMTYSQLILDAVYVNGRISKAKLIGVVVALLVFIGYLIYMVPLSLRMGALPFFITMIFCFFQMIIYYCICRLAGYVIRRFI